MTRMRARSARKPKHPIASVDNVLRLLLMFRDRPTIRVSEASAALGVGRSTGHRLMAMLEYHGLVEQDPETKAYMSGPALRELGLRAVGRLDVRSHMRPYLEELVATVNETAHVTVLDGSSVTFLDGIECTRPVRTGLRIGVARPAHCTAAGKVLLATLTQEELRELYPSPRLEACTSESIRTRAKLERELAEVRALGYSITVGENEPDIAAIAMAVCDGRGRGRAALSVSVPRARFDDGYAQELLEPLRELVAKAQRDLP